MVNTQHVYDFCNQLRHNLGAGFNQVPAVNSLKIIGEYYTQTGQLLSIVMTVYRNKVETKIYDAARRLIYNGNTTGNINMDMRLIQFIQRSVSTY